MDKSRLEAFSDGVFAIILTVLVLELRWPAAGVGALAALLPELGKYALSFVFVGIYWVNHHHTFQAVRRVDGAVLWANLHLLFWLSLIPFATGAITQQGLGPLRVEFYGTLLLGAATAYSILIRTLLRLEGPGSLLARAIGRDAKGWISMALYVLGMGLGPLDTRLSYAMYVAVALMWLVPDRRIEGRLGTGAPRAGRRASEARGRISGTQRRSRT